MNKRLIALGLSILMVLSGCESEVELVGLTENQEYLDQLSSDDIAGKLILDGVFYDLPCDLSLFIENGWNDVTEGDLGGLILLPIWYTTRELEKDGLTIEVAVYNNQEVDIIAANGVVAGVKVELDEMDPQNIEDRVIIHGGVTFNSDSATIKKQVNLMVRAEAGIRSTFGDSGTIQIWTNKDKRVVSIDVTSHELGNEVESYREYDSPSEEDFKLLATYNSEVNYTPENFKELTQDIVLKKIRSDEFRLQLEFRGIMEVTNYSIFSEDAIGTEEICVLVDELDNLYALESSDKSILELLKQGETYIIWATYQESIEASDLDYDVPLFKSVIIETQDGNIIYDKIN